MRFSVCSICRSKSGISPQGARQQGLGLVRVHQRHHAAFLAESHEPQGVLSEADGPLGDLEVEIERAELEIGDGHGGDEVAENDVTGFIAREQLGAGRLRRPSPPAPEVELEREVDGALREERVLQGEERRSVAFRGLEGRLGGALDDGELVRAGDHDLGLGVQDAAHGEPEVVVLCQGRSDQPLEDLVLEDRPPREVAE